MAFRVGLKAKQVIGVTMLVVLAIATLTLFYFGVLVRVWIADIEARGELVAWSAYQRAFAVAASDPDGGLEVALRSDEGLRSVLEAALFDPAITFAAITNADGVIIAHNDPNLALTRLEPREALKTLLDDGTVAQVRAILRPEGRTYEVVQPLLTGGGDAFGVIHVGVSTLLIRSQVEDAAQSAWKPVALVLAATIFVALILANLMLRPIAVISSNVARLGRGEFDAGVELPDDAEFRDVSESIKALGNRLTEGGTDDARRLVALSRLSTGIAHEIKNPLNAMSIHLELLRAEVAGRRPAAEYLAVVSEQLRRLDEVVQTFLKFSRPEQMTLAPVSLITLLEGIRPVVEAEAEAAGIRVSVGASPDLPEVHANYAALENALLNLAINGCQAMPDGGTLTVSARPATAGRVAISVTDTGVGIPPEQLDKIFNLYFTTKPQGTGIGLAMVYRTVQLHNGEISVESSPGRGTTFTVTLWAESASAAS